MEGIMWIVVPAIFLLSLGFSVLVNYLLLRFSRNFGVRNLSKSEEIRWSAVRKPALGGISFFISFLLAFSVGGILQSPVADQLNLKMLGVAGACSLGFLLGLADDAYNTNPLVKLIGQLSCSFILISTNIYIHATGFLPVDFVITTLWIIGMMNSINMLDNMDAISTTQAAIILIGILLVTSLNGTLTIDMMVLMVGVLGGLIGFLFFNWNPSKMYMGDTGSMFLGVFLAAMSMNSIWNERLPEGGILQIRQFVIPLLIFLVPLIDTTTVTFRRLMRKQSPFVGGKDHITHHLAYNGFKDKQVALFLIFIALLSIPVVVLVYIPLIEWSIWYSLACIIYAILMFIGFQIMYNRGARIKKIMDDRRAKFGADAKIPRIRKISGH